MTYVAEKKYMRLFLILLYMNPKIQLFSEHNEDESYIIHLIHLMDDLKKPFDYEYTYQDGELKSTQISNAIAFIKADIEGTVYELAKQDAFSSEKIVSNYLVDSIGEENINNIEYIKLLSLAVYLKKLSNANTFSEMKKYATKNKIADIPFENIKQIWKDTLKLK